MVGVCVLFACLIVMEERTLLKSLVNSIQLKVSIAVAFALIRRKPLHKSAKEYAKEEQEKYLKYWQNCKGKEDDCFNHKIICLQQSKICNLLQNIVPPADTENLYDSQPSNELVQVNDSLNISNCLGLNDSDSDSDFELGNAEFIRAMVYLKFAVDSWSTLPVEQVHHIARNVLENGSWIKATQQIQDVCASQEDSGFESGKMTNEKIDNHIVSSSIFRPVTHSSDTNFLLTKSLESVLKYVRKQITENAEETFSKWQGSILEHLFSILKKVLNIGFCTDLIVSLIQDILNRLWETSDGNKNVEWEYQCLILADLCNNELICGEILNFLSEKLNELVVHLQYRVTNCVHTLDVRCLEKSAHLVQLNLILLQKWRKFKKKSSSQKMHDNSSTTICNLWKIKWQMNEATLSKENRTKDAHHIWKECYEKLLSTCTKHFPLITYSVWEMLQVISSLDDIGVQNVC